MRKIITILCTLIFTINLSANAAMISVNEDSLMFTESKEEEIIENKNNEGIYENNEIKQNNSNELISDSEIEKVDENILSYDEDNNITTEDKNFIMQEQQDEFKEEAEEELFVDENINEIQKVEEIQANKEKEIKSYYGFEVVVEKGNSVEITRKVDINNRTSADINAYIKENYSSEIVTYDLAEYHQSGQISYLFDRTIDCFWLDGSANEKIKLSLNQGEKMTLVFPNELKDKLDIKVTNTPIAKKVSLELNKSYEIINSINKEVVLYQGTNDRERRMKYHCLQYDRYGTTINNYRNNPFYEYDVWVKPNGKTKIKVLSGKELSLYIPYEYIDGITLKESSTPVFEEFILEKDKIYEFTNNTLNEISLGLINDDTLKLNYITFKKDGKRDSVWFNISHSLDVEAENTMLLEVHKKSASESKLYIPYEYRNNLKISDGKVFNKVKIEKNKGYTIKNKSNSVEEIYFDREDNNKYTWDSVNYDKNGNMYSIDIEQPYMSNYIYSNDTEKMTFSEDVYLYTLYKNKNLLDIKQVSTPATYRIELIIGKSYELTNKSSDSIYIETTKTNNEDRSYDMVEYNEEGRVKDIYYNQSYNPIWFTLEAYSKIKISKTKGYNEVIAINYDDKDLLSIKELNTPVVYNSRIMNGEVYEFTNSSDNRITLKLKKWSQDIAYDFITYLESGYVDSVEWNSIEETQDIWSKGKINLSLSKGEYLDLSVPYELKDSVKKLSTPMFQKIEIKKGKSYEFKSSKNTSLLVKDENDEFRYDYLIYDDDGDLTETEIDRRRYGFSTTEQSGTYRIAMNSKSNMEKLEFYIPYKDRLTVKELNHPLIKTITLDNKNNYEIVNKMNNNYRLTPVNDSISNEVIYETISYDKNGNVNYIDISDGNDIPTLGGKIRISILKGDNLAFYVPYDLKYEVNIINTPLTFKTDILPDKTYEINNSYLSVNVVNDVMIEEFDVIQYGVNGDVVSANHVTADTYIGAYENINGITKIRLTKGEKLELVLPYENRNNIKETNTLLVKEIPFKKNKEYKIKNNNSFDIFVGTDIWGWDHIFDDVSYKITYYDSKGNIKETLDNQFSGFEIKANESVKLSINKDGYNLHVPYEATIVDDDSTPDSEKPILGDFNNDSKVDILDLSMLATKYNKQKGQNGWDSTYDLNSDFTIDLFDLSIVAKKL